jgi:hypothetical protein
MPFTRAWSAVPKRTRRDKPESGGGSLGGTAVHAHSISSILILILTRADVVAVAVIGAAIVVVVVVVAVGSCRCRASGYTIGGSTPSAIGITIGSSADGRACYRTTGYRPIPISTAPDISASCRNPVSATPHMGCSHAAAVEASGTHAAAAATVTATAATAGERIVWKEAGGDQNECCNSSEDVSKHDEPPQICL